MGIQKRIQFSLQTGRELKAAKEALVSRFVEGEIDALELTAGISALVDETVDILAEEFLGDYKDRICLVYTGANGREEICPNSDCDITAVVDESLQSSEDQETFEDSYGHFVQAVADARVANISAIRTIDYITKFVLEDTETWTQLIDRRFGWGEENLFEQLSEALNGISKEDRVAYIEKLFGMYNDLLDDAAKQDYSTTEKGLESNGRYTVTEPNTKKGYGSLRGVNTAKWILAEAENLGLKKSNILKRDDELRFNKALEFILTARSHLHSMIEHKEERLLTHLQPDIAKSMGYEDVTSFMRDYFTETREVSHYARIVCSNVAEQLGIKPPGASSQKTVNFENEECNGPDELNGPMDIMELFLKSAKEGCHLHYSAMHAVKKNADLITDKFVQNPEANRIMMEILTHDNAEETLMYMNRLGVLTKFVPEFESIREFMLYNSYHAHTIDDHSIIAIGNIPKIVQGEYIEKSPAASTIAAKLKPDDQKILSTVLLLHGIYRAEKSKPDNMQAYNRELMQRVGPRLGLEGEMLETATWLAENRLLLKHTSHFIDIEDPEEIREFAAAVPDLKHLELLHVLTFADTLALGPGRLTDRTSYRADSIYNHARNILSSSGLSGQFNQAVQLPDDYVKGEPYIRLEPNEEVDQTSLEIITPDKPRLLQRITAAIRAQKCIIKEARIKTVSDDTTNGEPLANNVFVIRNSKGQKLGVRKTIALQKDLIESLESDEIMKVPPASPSDDPSRNKKNDKLKSKPRIEFSNVLKKDTTRVHIVAPFGLGLFDDVAKMFNSKGLDLTYGHITRVGHNAKFSSRVKLRDGGQMSLEVQDELRDDFMTHFGDEETLDVA